MNLNNVHIVTLMLMSVCSFATADEDRWEKAQKQYEENVRIAAKYPVDDLKKAIIAGDIKKVTQLLDDGCPVSVPMPWSQDEWEGIPPTDYPILFAVCHEQIEIVQLLLDRGASPKTTGHEVDTTPLHQANDLEIAKLLVARGADVNARDSTGSQPIHYAAIPGYIENNRAKAVADSLDLIKFLIEKGADPLAEDHQKEQPIHLAARLNTAEVVSFFLSQNAKVDAAIHDKEGHSSSNGWQPIHFAVSRPEAEESLKITQLLISKGADTNAHTAEGETPLHLTKHPAITKLLLEHGAKPDITSTGMLKKQSIHHFAMQGDVESIKLLLDAGVNIESKSAEESETITPLDTAVYWQKPDAVKFLLERGAKITERTMKNALRFDTRSIETLQILHHHGGTVSSDVFLMLHPQAAADLLPLLNQENKDLLLKHSARLIAESATTSYLDESEGGLAAIRALVALGAKIDQPWEGLLPIHHATISGKQAVIDFLLSSGQPIDAKGTLSDNDSEPPLVITGIQPIHLAGMSHWSGFNPERIPYLMKNGAKIDAQTGEGWQPIHLAAAHGDKATLQAVIKAGGDPKAKARDGKTPLQLAEEFENPENAKFLKGL